MSAIYLKIAGLLLILCASLVTYKSVENYIVIKNEYIKQNKLIDSMKKSQIQAQSVSANAQKTINVEKFKGNEYGYEMQRNGYVSNVDFDKWLRAYEFNSSSKQNTR